MTRDLEVSGGEVHARAAEVLDFWFGLPAESHFATDADLDREIADRFAGLRDHLLESDAADWRANADVLLAAIIVLDRFSRNLYRGTPRAFEADDLFASLTLLTIERGWDVVQSPERRTFVYMPLMHAENDTLQALSVAKLEELGIANNLQFARDHAAVIKRFGRYPSRNAALGRVSTPAETDYLNSRDAVW